MAWIKSQQVLRDHPKVKRLARVLDENAPAAVGRLHMLWWWALDFAPDGDLSRWTNEDIAAAVDWVGDPDKLVGALVKSGWLDEDGENLAIHDWKANGGMDLNESREKAKKRMAARREQMKNSAKRSENVCESLPNICKQIENNGESLEKFGEVRHIDKIRQEEIREEENRKENILCEPQSDSRRSSVPFAEIMAAFNNICNDLPKITKIEGSRREAVRLRWKDLGQSLDGFREFFERVARSDFLSGRNGRGWRADFDWIMKAGNCQKIQEGVYDNRGEVLPQPAPAVKAQPTPNGNYSKESTDDEVAEIRRILARNKRYENLAKAGGVQL